MILLSGDISLNPGPSQYLPENDNNFEHFRKRGFNFFCVNLNSLLPKTDELRHIVGHSKPAMLGTTESRLDSSVSD